MAIARGARLAFAVTLIGLGIAGLIKADFAPVWAVPKATPAHEALSLVCAGLSLACGLGLLWRRAAALAARILLVWLLLWLLAFRLPVIVAHAAAIDSWENCAETLVVAAGAWALYAGLGGAWDRRRLGFATGERGLGIARALYGLALIPFGLAHFAYLKETAALVPAWLPGHLAWASFTGGAYIAAGVAILAGVFSRLAASLSALQIAGFTFLVWLPIVAFRHPNPFEWSEAAISWTLTVAAWLVASSYRDRSWLMLPLRLGWATRKAFRG